MLCLASEDLAKQGLHLMDPKAVAAYRSMGFELHFDYYQKVDEAKLRRFPVVVGMMPMLHAGTRAIDDRLGPILDRYLRDGGGFALLPAPSYYGVEDFVRQLNPWLKGEGAELLNEQPRDPAHQRVIPRVLAYRYLQTSNLADHPVTRGIRSLWLPIDWSDAFVVTHTMRVSPEWTVLVRGEKTCATHPYLDLRAGRTAPGAWASEPPILAVREVGKGRLALFTTSSQYYLFDAFHWAYGEGFVMKEGNGLPLMGNLLTWLAAGQSALAGDPSGAARLPPPPKVEPPPVVAGNVPICGDKDTWMREVLEKRIPADHRVLAYVDCGSLGDLPWTVPRGYGYVGPASWLIRWDWSEIFHATAANSRGFDRKPLEYRFDGMEAGKPHKLGVLLWGYQVEGSRPIRVEAGGRALGPPINLPRFADQQGPSFTVLDVPPEAISKEGRLDLAFHMAEGGAGSFSSVCELWVFAPGGPERHAPSELRARFESPSEERRELSHDRKLFRGLIGAQAGGAPGRVAELSRAAQEAGLDFMVFTENLEGLGSEGLERLKKDCVAASGPSFRAIPGYRFEGRYAGQASRADRPQSWGPVRGSIFQNLVTLPSATDLDRPYDLFWKFLGGEFGGGRGSPPTLRTPLGNGVPAWFQRFWRGFDAVTMGPDGSMVEDARELYAEMLAAGYGPHPRAAGTFRDAASIRVAVERGWLTTIFSPRLDEVELHHYASCIGNGPVFRRYSWSFDFARDTGSGGGILFVDSAWLILKAEIESPVEIEAVTLYSGRHPLRCWRPGTKRFTVEEPVLVARNHELWLHVRARDGREAFTGRFLVQDHRFLVGMCADNQNTICSLSRPPPRFERDERELYLQHSYWHTGEAAGQLGVMRDARDLVPRVIETGVIQPVKLFKPCPRLLFADGSEEDHGAAALRLAEASGDFNLVEYAFDTPKSRARSLVRLTSFRPASGGDTAVLVESELEAKEDLAFSDDGLRELRLGTMPSLAPQWKYSWLAPRGVLRTGVFPVGKSGWRLKESLSGDGGVLFWPSEVGSLLILPLDGKARGAEFSLSDAWNGREVVELSARALRVGRGEKHTSRFLVALHPGAITSEKDLRRLRTIYVDALASTVKLRHGRVRSSGYAVALQAEGGGVAGTVETRGRTDPLPVVVEGVNPATSCGLVLDGRLTVRETATDRLRAVLPTGLAGVRFFLGNLFITDRGDASNTGQVILEWAGAHAGGVRLRAHNPIAREVVFRVATHPAAEGLPRLDGRWSLQGGESVWLWGRGDLLVAESGALQVVDARQDRSDLLLEVRGGGPFEFSGEVTSLKAGGRTLAAQSKEGRRVTSLPEGTREIRLGVGAR